MQKVFAAGSMHDLAGKRVEVKSATPKGSGPQGRGGGILPAGMAAGRGAMGAMGAVAAPGMVGQFAGPAGYGIGGYMAPGEQLVGGFSAACCLEVVEAAPCRQQMNLMVVG